MKAGAPEGELVAGKYELVRLIGRGGMGSVWEGRHVTLGTRVACKFIDADFASKSPEARTRFKNEARAAASLRSKHVVDVYDYGLMGDGRPYIVMEFLAGESLADRLERVGRLPLAVTARIAHQVGRALQKAHAAGIIHRDLKPDNIFLMWDEEDEQDQVKVVDFGIAKFTDEGEGTSHATQTGSVVGTPFFMSPEQARGIEAIDLRSDLWALGVVTFQCLTGQLPFHSEAVGDLLIKICTGEIPVPSHVAPDLPLSMDAWMARALERDRDLRFQSAREMTEALADAIGPNARSLLESHVDDERTSMRPQLHLTAGPRLGQAITLSQHPRAVRRAAAKTATTGSFRPPSWTSRAAPWAAVAILVTGGTAAWMIARPGSNAGTEGGRGAVPNAGSIDAHRAVQGTAPDGTRTLPAQLEGTPLSELAVEQTGAAQPRSDGTRAPAESAAGEPEAKATPAPSEAPQGSPAESGTAAAAPPAGPVPPAGPTKNLDVGLGY